MRYDPTKIKNPLFRLDRRPDVIDVLYKDCFLVYHRNKNIDIYSAKQLELMEMTSALSPCEAVAWEVKLIHEQMDRVPDISDDSSEG